MMASGGALMHFGCFTSTLHGHPAAAEDKMTENMPKVGVLRASHKIFLSLTGKFE
jgi:hypothetical protein